jgi:endonuclease YncB( thermonuclease family)
MKKLPFIGTSQSKLLLIGSSIGIAAVLVLAAFMSLSEAEAQFSTAVPGSNPQAGGEQSAISPPLQEPSAEIEADDDGGARAAIELPPLEAASSYQEQADPEPILAVDTATCISSDLDRQYGSVVEVIDAENLSVLIGDELTTVRYLGIDTVGTNESVREAAISASSELIGQIITLVGDVSDSDSEGRLLRYVFTDELFLNHYLLETGLAKSAVIPPNDACSSDFASAQDLARGEKVGTWAPLKPEDWREWPIVPEISANAIEIYLRGLDDVNPKSFSIVGDCLSIPERLFRKVSWGDFELPEGMEDHRSTVEQFTSMWNRQPVTVDGGFVPASMFSSYFSDPERCGAFETPLDCEFRINNPSILFISIGTDQEEGTEGDFEFYMREIIEYSIERDTLPIITTKADPTDENFTLNHIMAQLAIEYDIPLWNFWAAVQHLPNTALNPATGIHLTAEGNEIRRVTALQVLHAILAAANR